VSLPKQRATKPKPTVVRSRDVRPAVARTNAEGASGAPMGVLSTDAIWSLQPVLGNAQIARLLQRRADPTAPPTPPSRKAPATDPHFVAVVGAARRAGTSAKKHRPVTTHVTETQAAVVPPSNDRAAQAKAAQVDEMAAAKAGTFDKASFVAAVRTAIAAKAPKTLEEADSFATSGAGNDIKSQVVGQVATGKQKTTGDLKNKTEAAPDESKAIEKPVTAMPGPDTGSVPKVAGAPAMPGPVPDDQLNLQGGKHETDVEMARADVTEEQLASSNEPQFKEALGAKKAGEAFANKAPGAVRGAEGPILAGARAGAQGSSTAAIAGLTAGRGKAGRGVDSAKHQSKATDEADRRKARTESILTGIDASVETIFTAGEAEARQAFEQTHGKAMTEWKNKRYSGIGGGAQWLIDKLTGTPPEVNAFFQRARDVYVQKMDGVISRVADAIGKGLTEARTSIETGRAEVKTFVAQQKGNSAKFASQAAKEIDTQFSDLSSSVDQKQEALVDDLASRYQEARGSIDDRVDELQAEGKGLWAKAKEAVVGVIDTIIKLKDMLMNVFARVASAIGRIIKDPIGFLGNLLSAVKSGIDRFASKISEHVTKGLKEWLFGELAESGIEIPETFDLKGVFQLVASVAGLTWNSIRTSIAKRVGEPIMSTLESTVGFVKTLATGGLAGVWELVKEKVGDLKTMVMDQIQDFVETKIFTAGITWLLSLLNPAAAFVKACKAIYDLVMFFVEKGSAIKSVIDAVLDSVEEVLSGGVSKVGAMIENALAKAVPVLIGMLASLLGLGGIGEKIQKILATVRKPVTKAIDFVVGKAVKIGKGLMLRAKKSKLGRAVRGAKAKAKAAYNKGKKWVGDKVEAGKKWVGDKVAGGKKWFKDKATKLGEKLGIIKRPITAGKEHHTLSLDAKTGRITMASVEGPIESKIADRLKIARSHVAKGSSLANLEERASAVLAAVGKVKGSVRKTGATDASLDGISAAVIEFLLANAALVTTTGAENAQDVPPGLGNIAPHKSQKKDGERLRSEHVIPRGTLNQLLVLHSLHPLSQSEYENLHTIMTYKTAATEEKDHAHEGSDNVQTAAMKSIAATGSVNLDGDNKFTRRIRQTKSAAELKEMAEEKTVTDKQRIMASLTEKFWAQLNGRTAFAVKSVARDHATHKHERSHEEMLPSEDKIRYAAALEAEDFVRLVSERQ
jgi:hypothetical protein